MLPHQIRRAIGERKDCLRDPPRFASANRRTSSALKHAFPESKPDGRIVVSYAVSDADWTLTIADDGVGKPTVVAKHGLGTSIVNALAQQLDARVEVASDQRGTALTVIHTA